MNSPNGMAHEDIGGETWNFEPNIMCNILETRFPSFGGFTTYYIRVRANRNYTVVLLQVHEDICPQVLIILISRLKPGSIKARYPLVITNIAIEAMAHRQ